ncbi:MAG: HAD hydrolase-like protein [Planctomycetaceae bacterium]
MSMTLQEYLEWLDGRDITWPKPPRRVDAKATPFTKPLEGILAVTWCVYGTLLRIGDGELLHEHPQKVRMQVALEKTIHEFNMWNSMHRTPEAPWEYMLRQYQKVVEEQRMLPTGRKGETPEVNSAIVWTKLVRQLQLKKYVYDTELYGEPDELGEKVAYFFHASLQGVEAAAHAGDALRAVREGGFEQGLLADAQCFTVPQLLRALKQAGTLATLGELFHAGAFTLSFQEGLRTPSRALFRLAVERFERRGITPERVLHVGCRLRDDLAVAREFGMRTALYAGDGTSLRAAKADVRNPRLQPDRLLTDLAQIRDILDLA